MIYAGVEALSFFTPLRGLKSSVGAEEDPVHHGSCWAVWASHCGFVNQPLHHTICDHAAALGHLLVVFEGLENDVNKTVF